MQAAVALRLVAVLAATLGAGPATGGESIEQLRAACVEALQRGVDQDQPGGACVRYGEAREAVEPNEAPAASPSARRSATPSSTTASPERPSTSCPSLFADKSEIDEHMRRGYSAQEGEDLREQLRSLDAQLCAEHCVHC
jgi:hypothetical protein